MLISNETYGQLTFELYTGPTSSHVTGLDSFTALYPFGSLHYKCYSTGSFVFYFFELNCNDSLWLDFELPAIYHTMCIICTQGEMTWAWDERQAAINKDQYILSQHKTNRMRLICEATGKYQFCSIHYFKESEQPIQPSVVDLQKFINQQLNYFSVHPYFTGYISNQALQIISDLTQRQVPADILPSFASTKMRELKIEIILELHKKSIDPIPANPMEETYRNVHAFILSHIGEHFTIAQLSRLFLINEFYLKTGFKALYGLGLFELLQQERMQYARHLLLTSDMPIKEIAGKVGYPFTGNFINRFTVYYGYSPGSLRRKR